jgi:hypothetical protein
LTLDSFKSYIFMSVHSCSSWDPFCNSLFNSLLVIAFGTFFLMFLVTFLVLIQIFIYLVCFGTLAYVSFDLLLQSEINELWLLGI